MKQETEVQTEQQQKGSELQLVLFKIAGEEFGVDINEVKEIIRWEEVTRIPNTEAYIKGVINLRGSIIVVNDLAMKLGLPSKKIDDETRILVVEVKDNTVGMVVDSATEVMRLAEGKVRDPPSMITDKIDHNYIEGVGLLDEKRLLTLLDLAKVLESKGYEKIMEAQRIAEKNITKIKDKKEEKTEKKIEPESEKEEKPKEEAKPPEEEKRDKEPKKEELTELEEKAEEKKPEPPAETPPNEEPAETPKEEETPVKEPEKTTSNTKKDKKN